MGLQTSYDVAPPIALAGMIADITPRTVTTGILDVDADAGQGVVTGTATSAASPTNDRVKLPTLAADVTNLFKGVLVYDASKLPNDSTNRFNTGACVGVMKRGRIWVKSDATLAKDGLVYLVNGTGAGTAGSFRGDVNGGAATLVPGAVCVHVASATLALVDFNAP
jgi:hypothetical protein